MSADAAPATPLTEQSGGVRTESNRPIRLTRVIVLLVFGFLITFSATMHETLGFDIWVAALMIGLLGIVHLVEFGTAQKGRRSAVSALLGCIGIVMAVLLLLSGSSNAFAVTVAAWGLMNGILEFVRSFTASGERQDAILLGALGILFAVLALLVREDPVSIIGFLGGYAIIAGVFLGISAFDSRRLAQQGSSAPAATR